MATIRYVAHHRRAARQGAGRGLGGREELADGREHQEVRADEAGGQQQDRADAAAGAQPARCSSTSMEFTLDPATAQGQLQDDCRRRPPISRASYALEASPDGQRTKLIYEAKSTDKIAVPFPASADRERQPRDVRQHDPRRHQGRSARRAGQLSEAGLAARRATGAGRSSSPARRASTGCRRRACRRSPSPGARTSASRRCSTACSAGGPGARQQDARAHAADQLLRRRRAPRCSSTCPATASPACRWRSRPQWRDAGRGLSAVRRRALRGVAGAGRRAPRSRSPTTMQLLDFLAAHGSPAAVVATKIDKLGRGERKAGLARRSAPRPPGARRSRSRRHRRGRRRGVGCDRGMGCGVDG